MRRNGVHILGAMLILAILIYSLVFKGQGLLDAIRMEVQVKALGERVDEVGRRNRNMMDQILELKRNPNTYEKLARERLGLAKENERVYFFSGTAREADSFQQMISTLKEK